MIHLGHREVKWSTLAAVLLLAWTFAAQPAAAQFKCFPSCQANDGKFLVVASGPALVTLSDEFLDVQFAVPAGTTSFKLGVFDGDNGKTDALSQQHWDAGNVPYSYTLYADPLTDGNGTTIVEMAPGFPSISSANMPDNDWIDFTITPSVDALAPSGNYFYRLRIQLLNTAVNSFNSFKLRTTAVVTVKLPDQPFSYIGSMVSAADRQIIYPLLPVLAPTNYDGIFRFFFSLREPQTDVSVWDGDFDHGDFTGLVTRDTDDPDTPNAPFLPSWSTVDTVPEGVSTGIGSSTGNPADDGNPLLLQILRPPSVRYELHFPDGQIFANENPSGNQEWEQFKISTASFDASQMDASTTSVPAGTYELQIHGVDLTNLNALRLPERALCVDDLFEPCTLLYPFLVGDTVFLDLDGNGVQSGSGEAGVPGVLVELVGTSGAVIETTTTDAAGQYSFQVDAGTYTVRIADASSDPGAPLDGAIATTPVQLTETVVDDNVLTYDFGYRGTGSIGDRLWYDLDNDGDQDTGEGGINDVTLELLDGDGNVLATTTTSGDGDYLFDHLFPGSYSVRVVTSTLPEGLEETYDLDGIGTPDITEVTLGSGEDRTDVDFGYRGTGSIGDRVWYDVDGDGVQDGAETGLNGVTVRLLDGDGNTIATTVTAGNGDYLFDNLPAGDFTVVVDNTTLPAGSIQTFDFDGTGTAHRTNVTLAAGEDRTNVDFGYRGNASLGDRVWLDIDSDGVQDGGETGLNGIGVELLNGSGTVIATSTTAGDGNYTFGNLLGGTYSVRVVAATLPPGATQTYDLDGTGTPNIATVALSPGTARTEVDFGYRGNSSLGDRVWHDVDGDGVQDSGEPGLNGVTVELRNSTGTTVLATTTTTGDGNYTFSNLSAGTYQVRVVASLPAGSVQTYDFDGTGTANTATVTLTAGAMRVDVDFGYKGNGSLGDRVWYDSDGDGVQDSGEPGLSGTTVELLNSGGTVIATRTTDSNGNYSFTNLLAGSYTVRVVSSTLPAGGLAPTYDLDGTGTAHTAAVTLTAGQNRTDVDFGYRGTRSLGDRVWNDADGDGVQDSGEAGLNGVTVRIFLGSTEVASTVTSGSGNYTFTNLPDLTYTVKIDTATLPSGMTPTYDLDGTGTPHQATVTLSGNRTDVDFGYRTPPVSCTAGTFKDTFTTASFSNNEGSLSWSAAWVESDTAGAGVSSGNVTVGTPVSGYMIFRDSPDTGTQPSAARQVNLSSFSSATLTVDFHIRGVEADDAAVIEVSSNGGTSYTVLETLTGYTGTYISSRTYDISAFKASNTRIRFRISANYGGDDDFFKIDQVRIDASCGGSTPTTASAGNRVWKDLDGDGTQDSGEPGLNGVTVQLLDSGGTVLATQATSGDGNYTFGSLAAGTYKVKVVSSTLPSGLTPTYDLDGTGTAHTATFTLSAGQSRTDVDFGYRTPPTCTAGYFKDLFDTASFSNNDGTLSWAGAWIESDSAGTGVSSGNVTVGSPYAGYLFLRDYPDTGTQPSAARQVNLASFASATLSFSFHVRTAVDPDDAVVVEVSNNGGTSYTVLETLTGFTGTYTGSRSYNISAYRASNTRIRFRVTNNYGASDELFKVDWLKIDAACQ